MSIPKRIEEVHSEDIQDVQPDILKLAIKYIVPIDNIRSIAKPSLGGSDSGFNNVDIDKTRQVESRAHAFLRYVGFPVVAGPSSNQFYNPGFDPTGQFISLLTNQSNVKKNVFDKFISSGALKAAVERREQDVQDRRSVFIRRDMSSSIYTLLLTRIRNFQLFEPSTAFEDIPQTFNIDDRKSEADNFFIKNKNINKSDIINIFTKSPALPGENFSAGRHILHPFVVDPRIDNTVMPDKNQIAVPFLQNKSSLNLEQNIFVKRPGLEFIITERLRDSSNEAVKFFQTVEALINNNQVPVSDTATRTENELRLTVEALLENNQISQSAINSDIKGITTVQVRNITTLVKTIRSIIKSLQDAMLKINIARTQINWVPLPSPEGPEKGVIDAVLNQKDISALKGINKHILELKIKKLNAERRVAEERDLGDYASPFESVINDDNIILIDRELQDQIALRDKIASDAFQAMGDIEIISGEISGLGLLDILAVYTALWALDERALISLLDDQAFNRLTQFFPSLVVGAASDRAISSSNKDDIATALEKFEKKLVNILTFIDREINRQNTAPGEIAGGTVSADN